MRLGQRWPQSWATVLTTELHQRKHDQGVVQEFSLFS